MPQYMLLLHEPAGAFEHISADEAQAIILRYTNWAESLAAKGHLRGGNKLQDGTGRTLRQNSGKLNITDGPYSETKEVVGGYFLIEAANYDEAVTLASDCPHLAFGAVELREVEPT